MTQAADHAVTMRNAFDVIEEAYEFMLAYAAQGRKREIGDTGGESQIRQYLRRMNAALDDLQGAAKPVVGGENGQAFTARFLDDIETARSVIGILLDQASISSEMVDNTNSLVAIRTFLTDIFFIDQVILPPR